MGTVRPDRSGRGRIPSFSTASLDGFAITSKGVYTMKKSFPSALFAFVVLAVLLSGCAPKPWVSAASIVSKQDRPMEKQNASDQWDGALLAENLLFSGEFEMKLSMKSVGENIIGLTYAEGGGEPWWAGTKRMELSCMDGRLGVILRDGASESPVYTDELDMPGGNSETSCDITIRFDQSAKKIQFLQNNEAVLLLVPEEVGDFQGGLFPGGKIMKVDLSLPPNAGNSNSGVEFSSVKLIELVFSVPPGE